MISLSPEHEAHRATCGELAEFVKDSAAHTVVAERFKHCPFCGTRIIPETDAELLRRVMSIGYVRDNTITRKPERKGL